MAGEQGVIESNEGSVYLPSRPSSPSLLSTIIDDKKIRYLFLVIPSSRLADVFIVTAVLEGEEREIEKE